MIGVTRVGDVLTIEMQRAERRNALNTQLVEELREAVEKAADSVDQRPVRRAVGLGHPIERAEDHARPVYQQPLRQGRFMVRPLLI